jgi:hypothetical protein
VYNIGFTVCSYNIGSSIDDYFQLCHYQEKDLTFNSVEEESHFKEKYHQVENKTVRLLLSDCYPVYKASIYCLQEVVNEERPIIQALREDGFEIIHFNDSPVFDNAIALNKKRFSKIVNQSINIKISDIFKKDVAIVTAIDHVIGLPVAIVSAHAPGFNYAKEQLLTEDTWEGDYYCQEIANKLSEIGDNYIKIFCADMNASPEKWSFRFELIQQHGFQIYRTGKSTNINPRDLEDQKREIDFFLVKEPIQSQSIWQTISSFVWSADAQEVGSISIHDIKPLRPLEWKNSDQNCSDHRPIYLSINSIETFKK